MQKWSLLSIFIMLLSGLLVLVGTSSGTPAQAMRQGTNTPTLALGSPTATLLPTPTMSQSPPPAATLADIATPRNLELTPEGTPGQMDEAGNPVPTIVPTFEANRDYEIINFLLVGHDSESDGERGGGYRTDTMIIVSINRTAGSVSMLSLPRDLYVYVPHWRSVRLNVVWDRGRAVYGGDDGGFDLMRETVLYNFGLQLHYYAMIDFSGFKQIIDTLGGVTIAVDCPIQDYRFTGTYDDNGDPEFELVTMDVGLYEMDSTTALFYARSRRNSNDFDRGRRQQQLLRAIWVKAQQSGWLTDIPLLYEQLTAIVNTNIPLEVMLQVAPLGLTVQPNSIESHFLHTGRETQSWQTASGAAVQLPTERLLEKIEAFLTPPTLNRLVREGARIGIFDSSGLDRQWDVVAADRLIWEGLNPLPLGASTPPNGIDVSTQSIIVDYTGETKGSSVDVLARILNIAPQNIHVVPNPNRTVDYAVYLSPQYNSCYDRQIIVPR